MPFFDLVGNIIGGESAKDAAKTSAKAQEKAARIAAEESRFRPVGVTTRFGSSNFQYGPDGRLSGAGYELSPEMTAYQDRLMALGGTSLTDAEAARERYQPLTGAATSLFDLGGQYLAESPEDVAAKYMARQQDLLAPSRERQYANLQNQLFQTGRGGLAVGATGERPSGAAGLGASNPEMEAYYNAIAQQDAALATTAGEEGRRAVDFGTNLFGRGSNLLDLYSSGQIGALSPFNAYLGGTSAIESLGQTPLDIGAQLGGRSANPTGANAFLQGGMSAARTMQPANAYNPYAAAISGAAENPYIQQGARSLFGGGSYNPYMANPNSGYGMGGGRGYDFSSNMTEFGI